MVAVYYTQTYYLDAALETIQSLKKIAKVHLLIEIAPESKKSTIIDVESLDGLDVIESFKAVLGEEKYSRFLPYLNGVASVHFVVHATKKSFSPIVFFNARKVINFINNLSPDALHFDTVSARAIGLIRLAKKYNIHITVHDPVPHSGEASWKKKMTTFLFYRKAGTFFFYSKFAKDQFDIHYPKLKKNTSLLRFQPFSFIRQFASKNNSAGDHILFFGRMSPYKGIDILLESIPLVLNQFPEAKFILAGNQDHLAKNIDSLVTNKDSVTIISDYLGIEQLSRLISNSKFVVCPYRDATQSGVLMTAFALGKPVLSTKVGAFPEYIIDGHNGLLTDPDAKSFAYVICKALSGDNYLQLAQNINSRFSDSVDEENQISLWNAYNLIMEKA